MKYESFPLWIFDERQKLLHLRVFFWHLCYFSNKFWKNQFHNKLVCFCCCSSQNSFLDTFHIKNLPGRHISLIPKSMAKTCPRYASQLLLKSLPEQSTNWGLNSGSLHYAMYISHLWINFYYKARFKLHMTSNNFGLILVSLITKSLLRSFCSSLGH